MKDLIEIILVFYIVISGIQFIVGISNGSLSGCHDNLKRIEYMFPAHEFGCYMGQHPRSENK